MTLHPSELKKASRLAGFWYLVWAITGMYSVLYVPQKVFVAGDTVATGARMVANEFLFKTSIVNGLLSIVLTLILMWALYRLFEQINDRLAKLMISLILVVLPAGFITSAFEIASLMIFKGEVLQTFDITQRQDLAIFLLRLNDYANIAFTTFWGLWLLPLAILVYKSRFLPRFLGIWLAINGVAYVILSMIGLFQPANRDAAFTYFMPAMFGELAFAIWLLVVGARIKPTEPLST